MMSKKYKFYVMNFLIALPMTVVMAFGNLAVFNGFSAEFLAQWFQAIWVGLLISYPATLIIVPIATNLIEKIKWK